MPKVSKPSETETTSNGTPASNGTKPKKEKAPKAVVPAPITGEVVYPKIIQGVAQGDKAFKASDMVKLMGWEEIPEGAGKDAVPLLHDMNKKPIRCIRNLTNRPFELDRALQYAYDVLNKKWAGPNGNGGSVNGENVIVGKYGNCVSIQHRGTGLILAKQIWEGAGPTDQSAHWQGIWPKDQYPHGPLMDSTYCFGIDEDAKTLQTVDQVRPRSPGDVLYTIGYYPERGAKEGVSPITARDRVKLCTMTEHAVRFLWDRTGAKENPYTGALTNGEFVDFLQRHGGPTGRLTQCVQHIWEENKGGAIARFMSPGYASALCYHMGCSASDGLRNGISQLVDYADALPAPHEGVLNWERFDVAQAFWVSLVNGNDCLAVRALKRPTEGSGKNRSQWAGSMFPEGGKDKGSLPERLAALALAWNAYAEKGTVTAADLHLDYDLELTDDSPPTVDSAVCTSKANFGGIDVGGLEETPVDDDQDDNKGGKKPPTPEEIEAEKERIQKEKAQAQLDEAANRLKAAREAKTRKDAVKATAPPSQPKPQTAKEVQEANTEKARLADEELARQEAANLMADNQPQ